MITYKPPRYILATARGAINQTFLHGVSGSPPLLCLWISCYPSHVLVVISPVVLHVCDYEAKGFIVMDGVVHDVMRF